MYGSPLAVVLLHINTKTNPNHIIMNKKNVVHFSCKHVFSSCVVTVSVLQVSFIVHIIGCVSLLTL